MYPLSGSSRSVLVTAGGIEPSAPLNRPKPCSIHTTVYWVMEIPGCWTGFEPALRVVPALATGFSRVESMSTCLLP